MITLEQAQEQILQAITPLPAERVRLAAAAGRFAAETVMSPLDLPAFDNSAMDGYAVRASDVAACSSDAPRALRLIGRAAAGEVFGGKLQSGDCVRVFTGSPLPEGADAVVMQEDVCISADHPQEIAVHDAVKLWENIRFRGEDVKRGSPLISAGERCTAGRLGLLAATGVDELRVASRPRIAVIATGSELLEASQAWKSGKIYESNRALLTPLLSSVGAQIQIFPLVPDALSATESALRDAFATCDGVVTCGGVSVGELDFVKDALHALGGKLEFWKVAIRPGKPFVWGRCGGKFLFGLPGNPVSAFVTFLLLVRPAVLRWQGAADVQLARQPGVLAEALTNPGDRRHFHRVRVDAQGNVSSAGPQGSHRLSSLAAANGLLDLPPDASWLAGERVEVLRWD